MQIEIRFIQTALIAFWTLWFSIVWIMNVFDALKVFGVLPEGWKAVSGNYKIITKHTAAYNIPEWMNRGMYMGVLGWQTIIVVGFWAASILSLGEFGLPYGRINFAFGFGLLLFAAFLLADEILKIYDTAEQHMIIFMALLVTLIAITTL